MAWKVETYEDVHGPGPPEFCGCCDRGSRVARFALIRVAPGLRRGLLAARAAVPTIEGEVRVDFDAEWICDGTWMKLQGRWRGLGRRVLFTRDLLAAAQGAPPEVVEDIRRRDGEHPRLGDKVVLPGVAQAVLEGEDA